jgi:hypothetical protein
MLNNSRNRTKQCELSRVLSTFLILNDNSDVEFVSTGLHRELLIGHNYAFSYGWINIISVGCFFKQYRNRVLIYYLILVQIWVYELPCKWLSYSLHIRRIYTFSRIYDFKPTHIQVTDYIRTRFRTWTNQLTPRL